MIINDGHVGPDVLDMCSHLLGENILIQTSLAKKKQQATNAAPAPSRSSAAMAETAPPAEEEARFEAGLASLPTTFRQNLAAVRATSAGCPPVHAGRGGMDRFSRFPPLRPLQDSHRFLAATTTLEERHHEGTEPPGESRTVESRTTRTIPPFCKFHKTFVHHRLSACKRVLRGISEIGFPIKGRSKDTVFGTGEVPELFAGVLTAC